MKIGFWRGILSSQTFDAADAGGGGGVAGDGNGGNRGAADRGNGGGGNNRAAADGGDRNTVGASGGTNDPIELSPDRMVRTSDGRVIKYSEYEGEVGKRIDGEHRGRYKSAYDLLLKEAQRIDALGRGNGNGRQADAANADPLAALDLDNLPIVDGKMAGQLVKMLRETGLNPIANLVQSLQKQVGDMSKQLKGAQGNIGTFNEERAQHEFESNLTGVLKSVQIKGLEDRAIDANNPALREFARNLYLSYQADSWRPGEFNKMLGEQLSGVVQYMRALDKDFAATAPDRLRKHFAPQRGTGAGRGSQPYKFKSARQIAEEARGMGMFGGNRT